MNHNKIKVAILHAHTIYSDLDGIATSKDYADKIKKLNNSSSKYEIVAMSITNHGNVRGLLTDHDNLSKVVKYIPGIEIYHNCSNLALKQTVSGINKDKFHLVLYAKNKEGLSNIYKIASISGANKLYNYFNYAAVCPEDELKKYGKGIIASTACIGSVFWKLIEDGRIDDAERKLIEYSKIFDELYLEIQPHEHPDQILYNNHLIAFSKKLGLPLVIGQDSHYTEANQLEAYKILHEIRKFKAGAKANEMKKENENNQDGFISNVKSFEEIETYCNKYCIPLEAITNTYKIAEQCNVNVYPPSSKYYLPKADIPKGYTEKTWLRKKATDGLFNKIIKKNYIDVEERIKRLNYELDTIHHTGYDGYFLIVSEILNDCRANGIPMGPGRGSGAGALTNYALNITRMDPIKNGYLFSRFITKERTEDPDIDSDVPKNQRSTVLKNIQSKYGEQKTAQIITYSQYKIKKLLTDSSKALGLPNSDAIAISKKLPADMSYIDIENAYNDESILSEYPAKKIAEIKQAYEELQQLFLQYPKVEIALKGLKNVISNIGCHAGGVCITGIDMFGEVPTEIAMSDAPVLPVTQFDMGDISKLHILKLDLLGLNTIDKIKTCMDLAGLGWDWYDSEDYSDPKVYEHLRNGHTTQVFQFEGIEATKLLKSFNVSSIEGLLAVTSANRPGALASIVALGNKSMVMIYEQGVKETLEGRPISFTWGIKEVDDYLSPTYRSILYQEQLMELGKIIAGYNDGDSDKRIRKPIGKKKMELIPAIETEFLYGKVPEYAKYIDGAGVENDVIVFTDGVNDYIGSEKEYEIQYSKGYRPKPSNTNSTYCVGAQARGFDIEKCKTLFDVFIAFGSYGFNKSHGGVYSHISYKTAWLSYYYPEEFAAACISNIGDVEESVECVNAFKKRGIIIAPPRINKSNTELSVYYNRGGAKEVVYGLSKIKGIGKKVTDLIVAERNANGEYKSFLDFYERLVNKSTRSNFATNLITGEDGKISNPINKKHINALIKAGTFDDLEPNRHKLLNLYNTQINADKDWEVLDEKEYELKRKYMLALEKESIGCYMTEHPLDPFPYVDFGALNDGQHIRFAGIVLSKTTRKGPKQTYQQVKANAKDGIAGEIDVVCNFFRGKGNKPNEYAKFCKENTIVIFCGVWNSQYRNVSVNRIETIQGVEVATLDNIENASVPNHNVQAFSQNDLNNIFG